MGIKLIITKSINFCGNSIKRQRQPQMAKINKLRGPIREFMVAMGAYSRGGGFLIICSSRVRAYSRGWDFSREGQFEDLW